MNAKKDKYNELRFKFTMNSDSERAPLGLCVSSI